MNNRLDKHVTPGMWVQKTHYLKNEIVNKHVLFTVNIFYPILTDTRRNKHNLDNTGPDLPRVFSAHTVTKCARSFQRCVCHEISLTHYSRVHIQCNYTVTTHYTSWSEVNFRKHQIWSTVKSSLGWTTLFGRVNCHSSDLANGCSLMRTSHAAN